MSHHAPVDFVALEEAARTLQDFVATEKVRRSANLMRWVNRATQYRKDFRRLQQENERLRAKVAEYEAVIDKLSPDSFFLRTK